MISANWPWNLHDELRFDRFMELALHDPGQGYYARRIRGVGKGGDFTTTPMLTPALGRAIADWATGASKESACRDLIELGPGEGLLAATVLKHLPWWRRPRLHLVERSAPLREKQADLLGTKVRWHDSVAAALDACGGRACLYSNEFADAFPVRCFRRDDDGWSELFVGPAGSWRCCEALPDSSVFEIPHPPGQIVEVAESYRDYLHQWLPLWQAGRMLTIDYGAEAAALYHRRPRGSLRAYFMQQRLEGPEVFERPGRQDLTADVNFTDLQRWVAPPVTTARLVSQREFMRSHATPADARLQDAAGAGEAFRVLEQVR
ncbi:SAM-dependent methyltransferase [Luteolibacter marinus]|uniref:SAM-dependent methyltransferase n=1 Tax=Luteolibacter marinus TaxID=2776705 RepID=UPI001867DCAC|nr:SAM-dependent methyltransferase [Luteolibacter marinus]